MEPFSSIQGNDTFCSAGLSLARTRWVRSTFSSHCPLSSNQCRWLMQQHQQFFLWNNFWNAGNGTRAAEWEASILPLCYAILNVGNLHLDKSCPQSSPQLKRGLYRYKQRPTRLYAIEKIIWIMPRFEARSLDSGAKLPHRLMIVLWKVRLHKNTQSRLKLQRLKQKWIFVW